MTINIDNVFLQITLNLSSTLPANKQYAAIADGVMHVFPCDATCLMLLDEEGYLTPVAVRGVSPTVLGRRFAPIDHPRLARILGCHEPVRFDSECSLPDPFDGVLLGETSSVDVHDCMGCSLSVEGQIVGVLTLDALTVNAFNSVDLVTVKTFAALTAATMRNIAQLAALKAQNQKQEDVTKTLIQQARTKYGQMVGESEEMKMLKEHIDIVAKSDYAVLITGETGTGKELVANAVHARSLRSDKPMIYVNCAALPEGLAESELFGHVKGAFTGAISTRAGKFELADGGTLFLDEVGELPMQLQAKLLRAIQQGEIQRVGSDVHRHVDVRIISATNRHLHEEIAQGAFRSDLYHRLNVFPIHVPALRERVADIPVLSGHLLEKVRQQFNAPNLFINAQALRFLSSLQWLGNVRELEHALTRAALFAIQQKSNQIRPSHFSESASVPHSMATKSDDNNLPFRLQVEAFQKSTIEKALHNSGGVWAKAAETLQMDRGNLYRMGKKLGIA